MVKILSNKLFVPVVLASITLLLAMFVMHVFSWDLSVPWRYPKLSHDEDWQLTLSKTLVDNGWILNSKYLGAPDIAHWYANPAPQTSSLHSVLMLLLSFFFHDAVKVQQVYFLLNFPLIALTSYLASRLLGIGRVPAAAVGLLYCFITYRFNFSIYAYLGNFFAVPLALVPVYWTLLGDYAAIAGNGDAHWSKIKSILTNKKFILGAFFVAVVALSDGYYSFFTLLLLGFATVVRVLCGDMERPVKLIAPIMQIVILTIFALAMIFPLNYFKKMHRDEFYPSGVEDSALIKHPFEAEVYSTNLKMLLAPSPGIHRVPMMAALGSWMMATTNASRKYEVSVVAPLGVLASLLLVASFCYLMHTLLSRYKDCELPKTTFSLGELPRVSAALSLFIFLCSTSGGIGAIIALIYPSIRAYDRFPIFLIFVLYLGAAAALTKLFTHLKQGGRRATLILLGLVCWLSLLDQIPLNIKPNFDDGARFMAERIVVRRLEDSLPKAAMVYSYPYSQYLTDNKYYGWGAYSQIRLYLHSQFLRWSTGASKNSPVDLWHERLAKLPTQQLLVELRAVGFREMVIDRTVVKDDEYRRLVEAIKHETGLMPIADAASELAFVQLQNPGYRLTYNPTFTKVDRLTVSDPSLMLHTRLSRTINRNALGKIFQSTPLENREIVIDRLAHPEVFFDLAELDRGDGTVPIKPISDMKGNMLCFHDLNMQDNSAEGAVLLRLTNNSDFDWNFNAGSSPISVGVNLYYPDGKLAIWDKGIRLPGSIHLDHGATTELRFPIKLIEDKLDASEKKSYIAQFRLVQDANAWFENETCKVSLNL